MRTLNRILVAAAAALAPAVAAQPADATVTQMVLGAGAAPAVGIDAAGTALVAWNGAGDALQTCRVTRAARACTPVSHTLPGRAGSRPFVFVGGTRVDILQGRTGAAGAAGVYRLTSDDGGVTFAPARDLGDTGALLDAVAGPGASFSYLTAGPGTVRFQNVGADGGPAPSSAPLTPAGTAFTEGSVGLGSGGDPYVLLLDAAGTGVWRRTTRAGNVNDAATWSAPSAPAYFGPDARLSGGPAGLFATGRLSTADPRSALRRFDGTAFLPPTVVDRDVRATPTVVQDAGRTLHAVYGSGTLRYATSDDGRAWSVQRLSTSTPDPSPQVAVAGDHAGVAVYASGGSVRLERVGTAPAPPVTPTLPASRTVRGGGASVTVRGPAACVRGGRAAEVRVTLRRGAGSRVRRIASVAFFLDGVRRTTDRRAPFGASLRPRSVVAGSTHTVSARITLVRRGGGTETRRTSVGYRTCA